MARVKRGTLKRAKHNKVLKAAKGYYGMRRKSYRLARQQVTKSGQYQYQHRRLRKREFRRLWIQRINAAARQNGLSYSSLMNGLRQAGVEVDRKQLADMAVHDPQGFSALAERAQGALHG